MLCLCYYLVKFLTNCAISCLVLFALFFFILVFLFIYCYAALLPRRGPHIASHSVCPSVCLSVCPSVRPSRYRCHSNIGHVFSSTLRTCSIFCFVYMSGPHIVGPSRPHKLVCCVFHCWYCMSSRIKIINSART